MVALMIMVAITTMAMEMMAMMTEWEMGEVKKQFNCLFRKIFILFEL